MSSATLAPHVFQLTLAAPKMLTAKEELKMMQEAFQRDPSSSELLTRLVSLLVRLDHFDEAIALLEAHPSDDLQRLTALYMALWSHETKEANLRARDISQRAATVANTPKEKAQVLADIAKVELRLSNKAEAEDLLKQSLVLNSGNKDAFKRLAKLYMERDPEEALIFAREMVSRGVVNARVLGAISMILSTLGRFEEAREAEAFERFHLAKQPDAPPGWESLEEFNEALAEEILNHPDMRYERYGSASKKTWRLDDPLLHRSRLFPQLQEMVRREITKYAEGLTDDSHPLVQARPSQATLRNWCVVTEGDGHETWHVHQNGWISGVYYIHVQDHISRGTGVEGCISFGMSDTLVGEEASRQYGERIIRPYTGLFMIFPSHSFHRTYPHHGAGRRICFAFDVNPKSDS